MAKRDDPIDSLFQLPLTEFIAARKKLFTQLRKGGERDAAERVKVLAKPPVSAWTVNQLYWVYRDAFDELIATGQRFRKAQTSGKVANMREALDARREALSHLSDLATEILSDAGHSPSLDTLRRMTSTLEALSASTSLPAGVTPGRLTQDVDPPGFDSFGPFIPSAASNKHLESVRISSSKKSGSAAKKKGQKTSTQAEASRREERQARIDAAKVSLQDARKALTAAQTQAKSLEVAQKRAEAGAWEAEKQRRHAEERFKRVSAASDEAAERVKSMTVELKQAAKALDEANRTVGDRNSETRRIVSRFGQMKR